MNLASHLIAHAYFFFLTLPSGSLIQAARPQSNTSVYFPATLDIRNASQMMRQHIPIMRIFATREQLKLEYLRAHDDFMETFAITQSNHVPLL